MKTNTTAVILTGMQNECFLPEGRLRPMFEGQVRTSNMLANTLAMLEAAAETDLQLLLVPTLFQPGYPELVEPVGVLAGIRDAGAFQQGDPGSEVLQEIRSMGDRVRVLAGNQGGVQDAATAGVHAVTTSVAHGFDVVLWLSCVWGMTKPSPIAFGWSKSP